MIPKPQLADAWLVILFSYKYFWKHYLECASSLESLRGGLDQKRRERNLPAWISGHWWGGDTKWATLEDSKGRLRAQKQTWPCSQFCQGLALQTRVCLYLLQMVYWGSGGRASNQSCPDILSLKFVIHSQANVKRATVFPPEQPTHQKQSIFKALFTQQKLRAEMDLLTLFLGRHLWPVIRELSDYQGCSCG